MSALLALFMRDVRLAIRVGGGGGIGVLFFLSVVVLMPFAIGPDLVLLARIGPAILWLGALLASLLTLDRQAQDTLSGLMRGQLAGGGIIVAATHAPLPLAAALELRLGPKS